MKRFFSDGGGEELNPTILEPTAKLLKVEGLEVENQEVKVDDVDLAESGSESIPSPTSSESAQSVHSVPEGLEPIIQVHMPPFLEVKCGNLNGRLHTEKFTCPGIREKCVEVEGCASLLTPIEFTIMAEKSKQKDWKGSIKHNGKMLRTLMENKQIDFYNHHECCSYKCHSRNYITKNGGTTTAKENMTKVKEARRYSAPATNPMPPAMISQLLQDELLKNPNLMAAIAAHCQAENKKRQEEAERQKLQKQEAIKNIFLNDPATFWRQTMLSKLTAVVLAKISGEFGLIARNISFGTDVEQSSKKMNEMIEVLGLSDVLCREMCGQFILPTSNGVQPVVPFDQPHAPLQLPVQAPIQVTAPIQLPVQVPLPPQLPSPLSYAPFREHHPNLQVPNPSPSIQHFQNNNNNMSNLSSSEKLEMMIQSMSNNV